MKRFLLILIFFVVTFPIMAQSSDYKSITTVEQTVLLNKLSTVATSLRCNFRQEKKSSLLSDMAVSTGVMYYKSAAKLRWEYTTPTPFTFTYNNGKVIVKNGNKASTTQNNRAFQELGKLVLSIVNGSALNNTRDFKVVCSVNAKNYLIKMIPISNRLKTMFSSIEITVNKQNYVASKIVMNEVGGDVTTIIFSDLHVNDNINDSMFIIK